eukprot:1414056-Pleurochrysis_carterae.AAC.2
MLLPRVKHSQRPCKCLSRCVAGTRRYGLLDEDGAKHGHLRRAPGSTRLDVRLRASRGRCA